MKLQPLQHGNNGLLTSLSNGEVHYLDPSTLTTIQKYNISETSINDLQLINHNPTSSPLFTTATSNSVKIFDIHSTKEVATIHSQGNVPFPSLDSRHGLLACGTELKGVDAAIYIYDIRKWDQPVRSLVDSHHDDVTCLKWHPNDPNILLSGSTDGYTNVYDLSEAEEEDSLHQVINFASIHSCGWLSPRRIFTLSHMETFAIHELNDKSDTLKEPQPIDMGDVREKWGCDYVVDVYPGFIATGKSQERQGELKLIPLQDETIDLTNSIVIPGAHDDEVIRDVYIPSHDSVMMYTCGEDGNVKLWKNNNGPLNVPEQLWDYSKRVNMLEDTLLAPSEVVTAGEVKQSQEPDTKEKKHKKKKRDHKQRYKPY